MSPCRKRIREAKIEQLLLSGLDHYFTGQFDQAINVWTRALFLDRKPSPGPAPISNAHRSALAERQRESEELLHNGVAAFDRGESSEARRLLEGGHQPGRATRRSTGDSRSPQST
jgi:hypothetical protein